ncbi:SRPBCC domain-containing protein [Georgenia sp. Z1344]|uniref:SRPBCC domain-containing protein n=1 Tax=Georgenia sp. Z1344 TaxID=3416706 RepID=UPI003CEDA290
MADGTTDGGALQRAVVDQLNRYEFYASLTQDPSGTRWLDTGWDVDGGADEAWRWFVEPALLARWSPMVPDRVLDFPGPATVRENPGDDPVDAEVLVVDPSRRLIELRWGPSTVRWWVRHITDTESNIELRQSVADPQEAAMMAAGWAICLSTLSALLSGHDVDRVVGADALGYGWESIRDTYSRNFNADR